MVRKRNVKEKKISTVHKLPVCHETSGSRPCLLTVTFNPSTSDTTLDLSIIICEGGAEDGPEV